MNGIATYKGRPITELSREELEAAYLFVSQRFHEYLTFQIQADSLSRELATMQHHMREPEYQRMKRS